MVYVGLDDADVLTSRGTGNLARHIAGVLAAGIDGVETRDGQPVVEGLVLCDRLRPARRGGRPVLVVEANGAHRLPLKLD